MTRTRTPSRQRTRTRRPRRRRASDMVRRVIPLLLVVGLTLGGLVGADDTPAQKDKETSETPLRLKRKKRADAPPVKEKDDKTDKKDDTPKKEQDKPKGKGQERLQPEDGPPEKEEEDKEVLERIARNMRAVEE